MGYLPVYHVSKQGRQRLFFMADKATVERIDRICARYATKPSRGAVVSLIVKDWLKAHGTLNRQDIRDMERDVDSLLPTGRGIL